VLMVYDADAPIRGDDLAGVRADHDESLRPSIDFTMSRLAAPRMGYVTRENLHRKLAIIFDTELLSAPVIQSQISDRGQITGNFTQEEVDFIVGILKSGSMPVIIEQKPISENEVGEIHSYHPVVERSESGSM